MLENTLSITINSKTSSYGKGNNFEQTESYSFLYICSSNYDLSSGLVSLPVTLCTKLLASGHERSLGNTGTLVSLYTLEKAQNHSASDSQYPGRLPAMGDDEFHKDNKEDLLDLVLR